MYRLVDFCRWMWHFLYALTATLRYVWWYRHLTIIAVTGTDGKSSTVLLAAEYLRSAGFRVAHYSSISIHNGETVQVNRYKMTMPGRGALHRFLAEASKQGATHAVVEVTSEGILQSRQIGIRFSVVAFTNITPEHIQRHGSFQHYVATKLRLVRNLKRGSGVIVWNASDATLQRCRKVFDAYKNVAVIEKTVAYTYEYFTVVNQNFAQAIVMACLGELPAHPIDFSRIPQFVIPGRMQVFTTAEKTVVVDYAHTIHAVELCLKIVRAKTSGRVIHVFGAAGGGRDSYKRPTLAHLSETYADIHIVTEENSFDEPTEQILEAIMAGFVIGHPVHRIPSREAAVTYALSLAGPNDTVICTAKGSEVVIAGPGRSFRAYDERLFISLCLGIN